MRGIADTGFLAAFANRNDRHHQWAIGVAEQVSEPLLTCEAVLAETGFHLRRVSVVLADLCLVRMSELYPGHGVHTVDRTDFRVYRRNKRETIPLNLPTGSLRGRRVVRIRCQSRSGPRTWAKPVTLEGGQFWMSGRGAGVER